MDESLLAILLGIAVAGVGGLLVPAMIARLPEPATTAPVTSQAAVGAGDAVPDHTGERLPEQDEPPKETYLAMSRRRALGPGSAAVSAVIGALLGGELGLDVSLIWLLPLVPVLVALSVIDWHTRLLPKRLVRPAIGATLIAMTVVGLGFDQSDALWRAVLVMVVVRSCFWILWFMNSAGFGFGDVRLSALTGLVMGWYGGGVAVIGTWVGFVIFVLPPVLLAVARRDRSLMKKAFPFGPAMAAGTLIGILVGGDLALKIWG